ncbi:MAG: hypothetical protein WBQ43_05575 [Terriglobales bacterium]
MPQPASNPDSRRAKSATLLLAVALVATPATALAQRGGGGGGNIGNGSSSGTVGRNSIPLICVHDCPALRDDLNEEDNLKNFRQALAVQATAEQRAAFARIALYTETASDSLQGFRKSMQPGTAAFPDHAASLNQALEQARAGNQNFLSSFSEAQKSGLREAAAKLAKADSDLDKQIKTLDQLVHTAKPEPDPIAASAAALDKALAAFQNEQLALAREMSILFSPGQGATFSLPPATNSITIAGQSISIPTAGAVSRVTQEKSTPEKSEAAEKPEAAEPSRNLFRLHLVADLSDLQLNVADILRQPLTRSPHCGERIEIRQATLTPVSPAALVTATLHFERWVCPTGQAPMEVAGGDATFEVKLTPSFERSSDPPSGPTLVPTTGPSMTGMKLASEITSVEATGLLRDSLRTGDLGAALCQQIAAALLSPLQKAADPKATLPSSAQSNATIQKVRFQDDGADQLSLVVEGQLQFTEPQLQQFAAQLKQRLAAQGQVKEQSPTQP